MRSMGQLWSWAKPDFLPNPMGMDSLNPEEEVSILKNGRSHVSPGISLHYYITFNDKVFEPRLTLSWPNFGSRGPFEIFKKRKMIRIEFPKFLAWFQTPQAVSRPSRPNFQPHRTVDVSNYIQLDAFINPWLVQKRFLPCSRWPRAALEV